jgi:hypothetical protein
VVHIVHGHFKGFKVLNKSLHLRFIAIQAFRNLSGSLIHQILGLTFNLTTVGGDDFLNPVAQRGKAGLSTLEPQLLKHDKALITCRRRISTFLQAGSCQC